MDGESGHHLFFCSSNFSLRLVLDLLSNNIIPLPPSLFLFLPGLIIARSFWEGSEGEFKRGVGRRGEKGVREKKKEKKKGWERWKKRGTMC